MPNIELWPVCEAFLLFYLKGSVDIKFHVKLKWQIYMPFKQYFNKWYRLYLTIIWPVYFDLLYLFKLVMKIKTQLCTKLFYINIRALTTLLGVIWVKIWRKQLWALFTRYFHSFSYFFTWIFFLWFWLKYLIILVQSLPQTQLL